MEDKRNEMMVITVYADDTGLFTKKECDKDNATYLVVPRWTLEEWYKIYEKDFKEETAKWIHISKEKVTFNDWVHDGYICEDFIGFYDFCIIKGIIPQIDTDEIDDKVFYLDNDNNKHIMFEGTYNECRRFGRMWNWSYLGYDLQLEIE